jgi:hypothetical protein
MKERALSTLSAALPELCVLASRRPDDVRPAALALLADVETPQVFACIARALDDLNKTWGLPHLVIELPVTIIVRGPLWKPNMRKLITTIALLALVDTSVAIAQTAGSRNPAAHQSTNSGQQLLPGDAPVGHRQPRADQVPSEKNPMDDSINRENAALDRMTKGICRGC